MNRRNLVLAALAAAGENATFAPVQIQKLFFLIDQEAAPLVGGPHFAFKPYDYGPFDRAVYDELDVLHTTGEVHIDASRSYRRYSLTPEGFDAGRVALATMPEATHRFLNDTATWVRGLRFDQLVAAIYRRYPNMRENSIFRS
jgi:uncharacterized protein